MEFCKECIKGNCDDHKWFTDLKLKDKNAILIAELNHIIDKKIINMAIHNAFLVYNQIDITNFYNFINYIDGELNFNVNVPTSAKLNDYYVPISSYKHSDEIVDYKIKIIVSIMRHTPIVLKVYDNLFEENLLDEVQLIDFSDDLHISMEEYHKMVSLATSRLENLIKEKIVINNI